MIALRNVDILTPGVFTRDPILVDATHTFGPRERVGILAAPGTGKSSLARMLAGIDEPDAGSVFRHGRVSWPIGFAGFLHAKISVGENLSIFARMLGVAPAEVMAFCEDFCEIAGLCDLEVADLTPTQRLLLAYACALSVPGPALWIADEVITVGQPRNRARCDEILSERLASGGLIFISRNARQLKLYCSRFLVLINRRLVACDDLDVANEALTITTQAQASHEKEVT